MPLPQLTIQNASPAPAGDYNMPLPPPAGLLGAAGSAGQSGGDIPYLPPITSGPFSMPGRSDMDQMTHYSGLFSDPRFKGLVDQALNEGNSLSDVLAPITETFNRINYPTLYGGRGALAHAEKKADKRKQAAEVLNALSRAMTNDQMGLEHNANAYDAIEHAYHAQRKLPYEIRTEYEKGSHQGDLAQAAAALGRQRDLVAPSIAEKNELQGQMYGEHGGLYGAQRDQVNALTPEKVADTQAQTYQRGTAGDLNMARTDRLDTLTPEEAKFKKAQTNFEIAKTNKARTANGKLPAVPAAISKRFGALQEALDTGDVSKFSGMSVKEPDKKHLGITFHGGNDDKATLKAIKDERDGMLKKFPQLAGLAPVPNETPTPEPTPDGAQVSQTPGAEPGKGSLIAAQLSPTAQAIKAKRPHLTDQEAQQLADEFDARHK